MISKVQGHARNLGYVLAPPRMFRVRAPRMPRRAMYRPTLALIVIPAMLVIVCGYAATLTALLLTAWAAQIIYRLLP